MVYARNITRPRDVEVRRHKAMRKIHLLAVPALLSLLAGCGIFPTQAGYQQMILTWRGATKNALIERWGPPDQDYPMGSNTEQLIYNRSRTITLPGQTTMQPVTTYNQGTVGGFAQNGFNQTQINGSYSGTSTTYVPQTTAPTTFYKQCQTRFTLIDGRIAHASYEGNDCRAVERKTPQAAIELAPTPAQARAADPNWSADSQASDDARLSGMAAGAALVKDRAASAAGVPQ